MGLFELAGDSCFGSDFVQVFGYEVGLTQEVEGIMRVLDNFGGKNVYTVGFSVWIAEPKSWDGWLFLLRKQSEQQVCVYSCIKRQIEFMAWKWWWADLIGICNLRESQWTEWTRRAARARRSAATIVARRRYVILFARLLAAARQLIIVGRSLEARCLASLARKIVLIEQLPLLDGSRAASVFFDNRQANKATRLSPR